MNTPELDKHYHCKCGKISGIHNAKSLHVCKKCCTEVINRKKEKNNEKTNS